MFLPLLILSLFLPVPMQQEPVWRVFMPTDSSFAVSVPTEPTVSLRFTPTAQGLLPTRTVSSTAADRQDFLVSWTVYPTDRSGDIAVLAVLDRARDALLQSEEGDTILAVTNDSIGSYPGRTTLFRTATGRLVQVRFVWVRNRFYQIMAQTPDNSPARAAATRFLRSFRVYPRAPI